MSRKNTTVLPIQPAWQARLLRLTAFPSPAVEMFGPDLWTAVADTPPEIEKSQFHKREQQMEGAWGSGRLELNIQPLRIDWRYRIIDEEGPVDKFPVLGPIAETFREFQSLMYRWLTIDKAPSLIRLAFGAVLTQSVETHSAGYERLSEYLPFELDAKGSSDFLYQINRPRASTVIDDLQINRLSKWAVALLKQGAYSPGSPVIHPFPGLIRRSIGIGYQHSS